MTRLSIIVATLGRATLQRTLASITGQMADQDELLIVAAKDTELTVTGTPPENVKLLRCTEASNHGDAEKNLAIRHATGSHLVFMDDDDVYVDGALDLIRDAACDRPVMFRMDGTNAGCGILWREPALRYTNVSTQMFTVPNDPARLGVWEPWEGGHGTDFAFIHGCCERMGAPVWRPEVVAVLRPAVNGGSQPETVAAV